MRLGWRAIEKAKDQNKAKGAGAARSTGMKEVGTGDGDYWLWSARREYAGRAGAGAHFDESAIEFLLSLTERPLNLSAKRRPKRNEVNAT